MNAESTDERITLCALQRAVYRCRSQTGACPVRIVVNSAHLADVVESIFPPIDPEYVRLDELKFYFSGSAKEVPVIFAPNAAPGITIDLGERGLWRV